MKFKFYAVIYMLRNNRIKIKSNVMCKIRKKIV
jgi:hypothetical protein